MQDYLLVRLQSPTKHAFVLGFVHRLEEFKRSAVEYSGSVPVVRYRDVILPLVSVNEQLGYKSVIDESKTMSVIVVKKAEAMFGLIVDEIVDTLATAADLDAKVSTQNGIFGSLNTPTELIVVVDPFDIIEKCYPESVKNSNPAPVRSAASSVAPVAPPKHPHLRNILLAEDTAFFRKAVKTLLEKAGYKVMCANDGKEAIDLLNDPKYTFDLIVSDIEMPRVNGFQLAEAVRKHPTHSALPMLAVSSRADTKSMEDGIKAGFDLYLEKLKPAILLNAVSELFEKGRRAA
jgi:two-component system chemotaxis sensor kinase CheA